MGNRRVVNDILTKAHICIYTLVVKRNARRPSVRRRKPSQERAKVTVDAMLDAAVKLLKRGGASSVTTNRLLKLQASASDRSTSISQTRTLSLLPCMKDT